MKNLKPILIKAVSSMVVDRPKRGGESGQLLEDITGGASSEFSLQNAYGIINQI